MNLRRFLAAKGIHHLVTRFGWLGLRGLAFDEKYRRGDWTFGADGSSELANVTAAYLRQGDLLIMGCGGASVIDGLGAEAFATVLGVDLSREAIRLAGRYASDRVSFQLADMVAFECPRPFDVILFSESLYYAPASARESLLRRLSRHLKPGGVFVVTIAQAGRYASILESIRKNFMVREDRKFAGSARHLIVFS